MTSGLWQVTNLHSLILKPTYKEGKQAHIILRSCFCGPTKYQNLHYNHIVMTLPQCQVWKSAAYLMPWQSCQVSKSTIWHSIMALCCVRYQNLHRLVSLSWPWSRAKCVSKYALRIRPISPAVMLCGWLGSKHRLSNIPVLPNIKICPVITLVRCACSRAKHEHLR